MLKRWLLALVVSGLTITASTQTLFTYGKTAVDAKDFLKAYNKNNSQPSANKASAMKDYLELYINSRLKIREAYARGYDTLPQIKSEVENLRSQIIENYMSDPQAIERLTKEAFQRSQKDIHIAHIFIAFNDNKEAANKKLNAVLSRLEKNDFLSVAQEYSDDPLVKDNKGDIGFITVFTLPYVLENIVYNTPVGRYSKPFTSKAGYHIFKNLGERKALGKMKVQQILLAFPPGADETVKSRAGKLADSLYRRILAGDDFGKLASQFSNDYISAAAGGNIPDIAVGQYDDDFEKLVWSLSKDGAVGKPIQTTYGYHIVKRISVRPVITDPADKENNEDLKQRIMTDDRWKTAKDFIYERVKAKPGVQKYTYGDDILWALTDSLLDYKPAGPGRAMDISSPLFKIGDTVLHVREWVAFAQAYRYKPDRSGFKPYPDLMDEFTKSVMYDYYRAHLEEFSDEFRTQMNEFRDGNLFFEIMQQEIWNRTQNDSLALLALYQKNSEKYNWKPSADAIIFFCADEASSKILHEELKKDPLSWKKITEGMNEKVVTDSSRYEWDQIPGLGKTIPRAGVLTSETSNTSDNTASFAYILKVYTESSPRTFNEARGLVMNDYQLWLEEQWVKELRRKYPVTVDQKVFAQISK